MSSDIAELLKYGEVIISSTSSPPTIMASSIPNSKNYLKPTPTRNLKMSWARSCWEQSPQWWWNFQTSRLTQSVTVSLELSASRSYSFLKQFRCTSQDYSASTKLSSLPVVSLFQKLILRQCSHDSTRTSTLSEIFSISTAHREDILYSCAGQLGTFQELIQPQNSEKRYF